MSAWQRSGVSIAEYCRREGLSSSTFEYWRRQLENKSFVRVGAMPQIELTLQNGMMLRIPVDAATLKAVLEALDA